MKELLFEFHKILSLLGNITFLNVLSQFSKAGLFPFIKREIIFGLMCAVIEYHDTSFLIIGRVRVVVFLLA